MMNKVIFNNILDLKVFILFRIRYGISSNARISIIDGTSNKLIIKMRCDYTYTFNDSFIAITCIDKDDETVMSPILIPVKNISISNEILNNIFNHIEEYNDIDLNLYSEIVINVEYDDIATFEYNLKTNKIKKKSLTKKAIDKAAREIKSIITTLDIMPQDDDDEYYV